MSMEAKEYLCQCNNCETVMYDENPQVGAVKLEVPKDVVHMEQFEEEGDYVLGCPNCETDSYLIDLPKE